MWRAVKVHRWSDVLLLYIVHAREVNRIIKKETILKQCSSRHVILLFLASFCLLYHLSFQSSRPCLRMKEATQQVEMWSCEKVATCENYWSSLDWDGAHDQQWWDTKVSNRRFAVLVRVNVVVAACKGQKRELAEKPSARQISKFFLCIQLSGIFLKCCLWAMCPYIQVYSSASLLCVRFSDKKRLWFLAVAVCIQNLFSWLAFILIWIICIVIC